MAGQLSLYAPLDHHGRSNGTLRTLGCPAMALKPSKNRPGTALAPRFAASLEPWARGSSVVSARSPTCMGGRTVPSGRSGVAQWPYHSPTIVLP